MLYADSFRTWKVKGISTLESGNASLTEVRENDTLRNFVQQAEMINPLEIKVITKLPNSEQSYKGKVQTHVDGAGIVTV
jgi:hypothetical protein